MHDGTFSSYLSANIRLLKELYMFSNTLRVYFFMLTLGLIGCGDGGSGDGLWDEEEKNTAIELSASCVPSESKYQNYLPPAGCECAASWSYRGYEFCGVCGKPDFDDRGPWCKTAGPCGDKTWAYCTLP